MAGKPILSWHNGTMTATYSRSYAITRSRQVQVGVIDHAGYVDGLAACLPMRWATRQYESLYEMGAFDLLVISAATPHLVAAARLIHPDAIILAVIDANATAALFRATLHAGADACVRAGGPAMLAGHLLATYRRHLRRGHLSHSRAA
jgi:hypothetical protein